MNKGPVAGIHHGASSCHASNNDDDRPFITINPVWHRVPCVSNDAIDEAFMPEGQEWLCFQSG